MRIFLLVLAFGTICSTLHAQTSLYDIAIDSSGTNSVINLNTLQGKKILIVNADDSDTSLTAQIRELKQLLLLYKGRLSIVIIPSGSFSGQTNTNTLQQILNARADGNPFIVTGLMSVKGADISMLYQWLTQKSKNGVLDSEVMRPFQKYLINESGRLMGVFSGKLTTSNTALKNAIARQ